MNTTNNEQMYSSIAKHYDKIYRQKDYQAEADKIKKLIAKYKKSFGKELLDVACGTGNHLALLVENYNCTGIDISHEMLAVAKDKIPEATLLHGDMTNLDLDKQFDVIICMFSSIGYVKTKENLERTIQGFADHLKKGGIVIIHPWLTEEMLVNLGKPHMTIYDSEDLKIVRMNITEKKGKLTTFKMHYLIGETDKPVKHYVDYHELGLFPTELQLELMKKSGLESFSLFDEPFASRGLLVGIKL